MMLAGRLFDKIGELMQTKTGDRQSWSVGTRHKRSSRITSRKVEKW